MKIPYSFASWKIPANPGPDFKAASLAALSI
jgi:hypothetical protein